MSRLKVLMGGSTAGALAIVSALTFADAPAEADFAGANGPLICQGLRGPAPAPPGVSRSEIFSVNPDGSDERVLSNNTTLDRDAVFSPDGTRIAFAAQRDNVPGEPNNTEIYVANNDGDLEGPDVRRLTFNDGSRTGLPKNGIAATDQQPAWSPDGTQIVFHSGREAPFNDGGTARATDFEIYKMSSTEGERDLGQFARLTVSRGQDAIPSWSPDGTKIAFQSLREGSPASGRTQNLEIFTMNPNGTDVTNITQSPGTLNDPNTTANENSDAIDSFPRWSPDSSQIAFGSTRDRSVPGNQNFEVYRMNRDGSNQTRLTLNLSGDTPVPEPKRDYDHVPNWSPDGNRILFHSGRTSTAEADEFVAYTMDSRAGEAAGLQRVAQTDIFADCDWQALAVPPPDPGPGPGPGPAPGPGTGPTPTPERVRPNLIRPGFARAVQTGGASGSAVANVSQSGSKVVVRLRGKMIGTRGRPCAGRLKIGTRAGLRRVATRTGRMRSNCRYSKKFSFPVRRLPPRLRPRDKTLVLTVVLRFQGNSALKGDLSPPKRIKVRR